MPTQSDYMKASETEKKLRDCLTKHLSNNPLLKGYTEPVATNAASQGTSDPRGVASRNAI